MKKYWKESLVLLAQLVVFYIVPLFSKPLGPIGMVLLILSATFILAVLAGGFVKGRFKYLYPLLIALLFIPSIFIYYNESALIHSLWYLVVAFVGLSMGDWIRYLKDKR